MTGRSPLIGVIDLRNGRAVHAIAGNRKQYRDVVASGIEAGNAIELANKYRSLAVTSLYVADLDAINGNAANQKLLANLSLVAESLLIDAGSSAARIANAMVQAPATRFIVPTESFGSIDQWSIVCDQIGCHRAVLGLDLIGNQLRTSSSTTDLRHPCDDLIANIAPWIDHAVSIGVRSVVVLDLAYVGTSQGPGTTNACKLIAEHWPQLELISGGGIRHAADVNALMLAGCHSVLVATALHNDDTAHVLTDAGSSK